MNFHDQLRRELNGFLATVDWAHHRERDPVATVWHYDDPVDQEVVGLIAAAMAYGQVDLLTRATRQCLEPLGPRPAEYLRAHGRARLPSSFVYRMTRAEDLEALFRAIGAALRAHDTLEQLFREGFRPDHTDYRPALTHFVHTLRGYGQSQRRGFHYLLADPAKQGACKRLNLYLRWMIRGPDAIDLGLWDLPADRLVMPLDTHIVRIARYLGLATRKTADWKLALEVRDALAHLDPLDPLKYDFALCHLGISGRCPRRRDASICIECPIQAVCTL